MTARTILSLPPSISLSGDEQMEMVQSGASYRVMLRAIATFVGNQQFQNAPLSPQQVAAVLSAALDMLGDGQPEVGDVLVRSSTGWIPLAAGTAGQVLTARGVGLTPEWATPASGGLPSSNTLPANTAQPTISPGNAQVGVLMTCSTGTWTGSPFPTFTYQWYIADTNTLITSQTTSTFTPRSIDVGHQLMCRVTATNVVGAVPVDSVWSQTVISNVVTSPPTPVSGASITGTPAVGATLVANPGTWTGSPTPTFTYQWSRGSTVIPGATSSSYVVQDVDYSFTLKVAITGTNSVSSQTINSVPTVAVPGVAPANIAQPSISNLSPIVGQQIDATVGTWSGIPAPTYAYQWYYGDTSINIAGATGAGYIPVAADVGHQLNVFVVATSAIGSAVAYSPFWTQPVAAAPVQTSPPVPSSSPVITGTPQVGTVLSVSTGTWTGTPAPTFQYQWSYGDTNSAIPGATNATYTPITGDVGHTLKATVTATNSAGTRNATSSTTAAVIAAQTNIVAPILVAAPVISGSAQETAVLSTTTATWSETPIPVPTNTAIPVISGTKIEGQTLSSTNGTWTGSPLSYAYQWKRDGVNISAATASTYVLTSSDIGKVMTVAVTASNGGGASIPAVSAGFSPISAAAPVNTVLPAITGTHAVGDTLTVSNGTWTSSQAITYNYQWTRDGSNLAGANTSTYVIVTGDLGHALACVVTASNIGGSGTATAANVSIAGGTPTLNGVAATVDLDFLGGVYKVGGSTTTLAATVDCFNFGGTSPVATDSGGLICDGNSRNVLIGTAVSTCCATDGVLVVETDATTDTKYCPADWGSASPDTDVRSQVESGKIYLVIGSTPSELFSTQYTQDTTAIYRTAFSRVGLAVKGALNGNTVFDPSPKVLDAAPTDVAIGAGLALNLFHMTGRVRRLMFFPTTVTNTQLSNISVVGATSA